MPSSHCLMTERRLPVVILISGRGSNMCKLVDLAQHATLPIDVRAVISDRAECPGLQHARDRGIEARSLSVRDFPSRESFDASLADLVESYAPKLVVLAGYMKILSAAFVRRFAGRLLNIHPSLLPKYPGLHTHRRALADHAGEHGASVHFVVEALDNGPTIIQGRVPVGSSDTEEELAARVHHAEYIIYPQAVEWFARGRLTMHDGKAWLDERELKSPVVIDIHP
jgi:phosphoribosylglycinamide formyltransferase-1